MAREAAASAGASLPELPPARPSPPAAAGAPASSVWLHIDGPSGLELQHDLDSMHGHDWETVCVAPCDRAVPSDSVYRIAGGGRKSTGEIALAAPDGGRERIRVRGGSKALFVLGWIGIGVGAVGTACGFEVLLAPVVSEYLPAADGHGDTRPRSGQPVLGWSLLAGGVAVGIGSVMLMLQHRKSTVVQEVEAPAQAASPPAAMLRFGGGEPARDARDGWLPRATFAPVVSGAF